MDELHVRRVVSAPPELVYAMWTEPQWMREWLFASESGELVRVESNPVPGGAYTILELNDGVEIDHFGTYSVADCPHHLEFSLTVPRHFPETTRVSVEITPDGDGSTVDMFQTGIDPNKTRAFWEQMLDQLVATGGCR